MDTNTQDLATGARPHIIGLGGSLRHPSTSRQALDLALQGAAEAGATVELVDLRTLDLPMYGGGGEAPPGAVRLAELAGAADGMVWSSPLYHGTISASFKNALDWLQLLSHADPPYLSDKPIGLIATSGGVQALQAINTMEYVVRALRGWTVPLVVPIARAYQAFDDAGRPREAAVATQLSALGREVTLAARRFAATVCDNPIPVLFASH